MRRSLRLSIIALILFCHRRWQQHRARRRDQAALRQLEMLDHAALQDLGMTRSDQVIEHAFPDHARIASAELDFADSFDILMTEKDAVKVGRHASDRYWYVPVEAHIAPHDAGPWVEQIESRLRDARRDS